MPDIKRRKLSHDGPPAKKAKANGSHPKNARPSTPESAKAEAEEARPSTTVARNAQEVEQPEEEEDAATPAGNGPDANKTFADLGVTESLCDACESLGFKNPTPIQTESIPVALGGR
ncbi:hypothetical protein KC336_g22584, partial [Hortaea werneckii]